MKSHSLTTLLVLALSPLCRFDRRTETIMNAKPTLARPSSLSITVVAALAAFIAIGLLTAVTFLFQRDGAPMARLAAAERACAQFAYVSEREICMRQWIAAASAPNVASR